MNTVKIRWLGAKKARVIELPIGLDSASAKTGEVVCAPVGEFPADEAKKLLALPGASKSFVLESEYQAQRQPATTAPVSKDKNKKAKNSSWTPAKREEMAERMRKMNEAKAAKKAAAAAAGAVAA
jgi:hypothetical protein